MTPAARDVWKRAGKTTVQALVSSAAIAYARYQANPHGTLLWPGALAGLAGAGAGGASVVWNGSAALVAGRRAKKLAALDAWGHKLVADALAEQGVNPPTP